MFECCANRRIALQRFSVAKKSEIRDNSPPKINDLTPGFPDDSFYAF
tara:strand:+ start:741 stop:881 length:141 start_codon:yes stop_codon:yes gene_type:complete